VSSSFRRVVSQISTKLPRSEDKELLSKLAEIYEKGGAEAVKDALEEILESIESE
jgi:predicted DNA-binding protein